MKVSNLGLVLVWVIIASILIPVSFLIRNEANRPLEVEPNIPDWDHNKEPLYFDFYTEKWVYRGDRVSRANDHNELSVEQKALDEYLQRKVKGYKESTYWGEEYDLNEND